MKHIITIAILLAAASNATAETCEEKFVRVMTERNDAGPVKIHITQEIKGGMKSVNWNYQDGEGNWMSEMVEPANMAWSMVSDGILYSSNDKGKNWKKIREMDIASTPEEVKKLMEKRSATIRNTSCSEEELDGVMHEIVEGDYDLPGSFKAVIHDKYWINPETGWLPKLETLMKGEGFESFSVQLVEPAPDLKLPKP